MREVCDALADKLPTDMLMETDVPRDARGTYYEDTWGQVYTTCDYKNTGGVLKWWEKEGTAQPIKNMGESPVQPIWWWIVYDTTRITTLLLCLSKLWEDIRNKEEWRH